MTSEVIVRTASGCIGRYRSGQQFSAIFLIKIFLRFFDAAKTHGTSFSEILSKVGKLAT